MALLQSLIVYTIAFFVGLYMSLRLAIRYVLNPSAFPVKKRDTPPKCLTDPDLGIHGYLSLKVSTYLFFSNQTSFNMSLHSYSVSNKPTRALRSH
jgi:hypothetical protein